MSRSTIVLLALLPIGLVLACGGGSSGKAATVHKTGAPVKVGYTSYTVHSSRWASRLAPGNFMDRAPNAKFLFVELSVKNEDKEARMVPPLNLVDENGAKYDADSTGTMLPGAIELLTNLNPSVSKRGFLVFDVPQERTYRLQADGGYWSNDSALIELQPSPE